MALVVIHILLPYIDIQVYSCMTDVVVFLLLVYCLEELLLNDLYSVLRDAKS